MRATEGKVEPESKGVWRWGFGGGLWNGFIGLGRLSFGVWLLGRLTLVFFFGYDRRWWSFGASIATTRIRWQSWPLPIGGGWWYNGLELLTVAETSCSMPQITQMKPSSYADFRLPLTNSYHGTWEIFRSWGWAYAHPRPPLDPPLVGSFSYNPEQESYRNNKLKIDFTWINY